MQRHRLFVLLLASFLLSCEQDDNLPKASTMASRGDSGLSSAGTTVPITAADWHFNIEKNGNRSSANNYQPIFRDSSPGILPTVGRPGVVGRPTKVTSFTVGMGTSALTDTAAYCYWTYSVGPPTTLRVGGSLTLTAKVRLDNVQGQGVSLVLRGDHKGQTAVFITSTEGKLPLKGTADFTEYSVTLPYTTAVDSLIIYLLMRPNTTGAVTFTDVALLVQ